MAGEDPAQLESGTSRPAFACHLRLKTPEDADRLLVGLNGASLGSGDLAGDWVSYPVQPQLVRRGLNRVQISVKRGPPASAKQGASQDGWDVHWKGRKLVKYPARLPWRSLLECSDYAEEEREGRLFMADRGVGADEMANLVYPWHISPDDETVVEARVKVVQTDDPLGVCIRVANGSSVEYVTLGAKSVGLHYADLTRTFDTTSSYHTYRIVVKRDDIRVYADGELVLDGAGKFTVSALDESRWLPFLYGLGDWNKRSLAFGSATGPGTGAAMWELVRFRSDTKFMSLLDLAMSVRFPETER